MADRAPAELELIAAILERLGYPAAPGDDELLVQLSTDETDRTDVQRRASVRALHSEGVTADTHLLVFDAGFEFATTEATLRATRLAAAALAPYLVLGRFDVDDDASIHLRYAAIYENANPIAEAVLEQTIKLLDYQQLHFGEYLEPVADGELPIELFDDFVEHGEQSGLD